MKNFLKSLFVVAFVFGCSEEGTNPVFDDTEFGPFETISVEPMDTGSFDQLSTLSVDIPMEQETVTFDPYNTVSLYEPTHTASVWPMATDEQDSDTGSETEEELNCHTHYHCHWYSCHDHSYCHCHYHCEGHH